MKTTTFQYQESPLFDAMFRDRGEQFVTRLQWNIGVDEAGRERDRFDDDLAFYLIQHEGDRHLASMRCRWMSNPTLVSEVFPQFLEFCDPTAHAVEVTRFCAAPGADFDGRALLHAGWELANEIGAELLYGIFTPSMTRIYRRFGWEPQVLARDGRIWFGSWDVKAKTW